MPTLDLHGLTANEAENNARAWLRARQAAREPTVIVVTGRGRHSAGLPVLPGVVRHLLEELRGTVVNDYGADPAGGAFRIDLRMPTCRARGQRRSEPVPDPALHREAEVRLHELGVSPTPALVRAEVARIVAERGLEAG